MNFQKGIYKLSEALKVLNSNNMKYSYMYPVHVFQVIVHLVLSQLVLDKVVTKEYLQGEQFFSMLLTAVH